MTKERFDKLQNNSIVGDKKVPLTDEEKLTKEEWKLGYHYCFDWDGLFIGPDSIEADCCSCHPINRGEQ